MTLSLLEIGKIQGFARSLARHGPINVKAVARYFRRSWETISMALCYTSGNRGVRKARKVDRELQKRRRKVTRLATQTATIDGRVYPVNCTAPQIANALGVPVGRVRRDLKAEGFVPRVRTKVPSRDPAVHVKRYDFTALWRMQTRMALRLVFSDEHTVSLNDHGSRIMHVRMGKDPVLPRERRKHVNIARVMIWAAVGIGFKSEIILFPQENAQEDGRRRPNMTFRLTADSYIRRCLSKVAPALAAQRRLFQHDNATPHGRGSENSRAFKYLNSKGVQVVLSWPPHSPDLNMIEYIWPILNRRVSALKPTNLQELIAAIKQGWASITQEEIDAQCAHFTTRVNEVFEAKGLYP